MRKGVKNRLMTAEIRVAMTPQMLADIDAMAEENSMTRSELIRVLLRSGMRYAAVLAEADHPLRRPPQ